MNSVGINHLLLHYSASNHGNILRSTAICSLFCVVEQYIVNISILEQSPYLRYFYSDNV
nr:MAG TPA: hypothetical protein [Bacteriophage sp.]